MSDFDDRVEALSERISASAALYIQRLRDHPKFAELLAELEKLEGTIVETDIDQTLRRFLIQHPSGTKLRV